MLTVDLHSHSRFFHGAGHRYRRYDPWQVRVNLLFASRRGIDGFAITNHDYYRPETIVDPARCLPGIEITTSAGHLLVVGPDPPTETEPGQLDPHEAVAMAHDRDCAAIVAHPFRDSNLRNVDADYDAVELNGKHTEIRRAVDAFAEERDLPIVGGSDAHYPIEIGRTATRIDADTFDPGTVVDAIRNAAVEPVTHTGPIDSAIRTGYALYHRATGTVVPPELR
jgi:predicted metal-dependent phosphoesterase TrpH